MTDFNETDVHAALTAIANGTLTQCKERLNPSGLYRALHENRFIKGTISESLNFLSIDDVSLNLLGRRCLETFNAVNRVQ
ncbi:hypothetical protein [Pseudomonas helleri]|uniref:hypothetical protein n=1 Tax=Pseudomonas helleri TaxID=1608996 RepID=UPI001885AC07|nr:hypothetical protein [Pseudomonas helleri]